MSLILIIPIKIYQWVISPWLPKSCRHIPSCSNYAIEAIKTHGFIRGFWLGFVRVLRCNPWGTHGYDPVPPKMTKKEWKKYREMKNKK